MEFKYAISREIQIRPSSNNGFIVQVGCQQFVYTSAHKLTQDLKAYLKDPETVEKQFNEFCEQVSEEVRDARQVNEVEQRVFGPNQYAYVQEAPESGEGSDQSQDSNQNESADVSTEEIGELRE